MTKLLAPLLFVLLAGCASPNAGEALDEKLQLLRGKNIQVAIDYLGIPDDKKSYDGYDVYVWQITQGSNLECKIKIKSTGGIVRDYDYQGNNGPCYWYVERLANLGPK